MSNDLSKIESLMIQGDLSKFSDSERVTYYIKLCESLGLNHMSRPFEYITLQGKLSLYARKDATEQLRKLNKISISKLEKEVLDGVYIVTAHAQDASGRIDTSTGAVSISNLKGEALANAFMKAETKAKRRVTLSIAGLGMLDESESDSIPGAYKVKDVTPRNHVVEDKSQDDLSIHFDIQLISEAKNMDELKTTFLTLLTKYKGRPIATQKLIDAKDSRKHALETPISFPEECEESKDYFDDVPL